MNEAETRAEHIDPALKTVGWGVVDGTRVRRDYRQGHAVDCILGSRTICFYPSGCSRGGRFECYREAWHLLVVHSSPACPAICPNS